MQPPGQPDEEAARINALHALKILDTPPEERFDRLTRLARRLFGVPIALVSRVDEQRQWFKSCVGLDASETPIEISFCGHAILGDDILLVTDATADERFRDNPLVTAPPHIRFYAGCPLKLADGSKLGTLCIMDHEPREFGKDDKAMLRDLARMAEQEFATIQMATMDEMTLLSNRRGFQALSALALGLCRRQAKPAWLLFFDLDLFKQINDRFGHAEGDRALVAFAHLLKRTFRESDVLGRLGGDEFAVLVTDAGKDDLEGPLQRLRDKIDKYNQTARRGYNIEYSVGTVLFDARIHAGTMDMLVEADTRMYQQKRQRSRQNGLAFSHALQSAA